MILNYLSVKDSAASPASTFYAAFSTDAGNNTGWIISPSYVPIVASLNVTLEPLTLISNATLQVRAVADITLDGLTLVSVGKVATSAELGIMLDALQCSAIAHNAIKAELSVTLEALTCDATAMVFMRSNERTLYVKAENRIYVIQTESLS